MNLEKKIKIIIISIIASVIITVLGNMIFWSIAMGKVEVYPSSPEEYLFIENVEEKTNLWIMYDPLPKGDTIQDIDIRKKGYVEPSITLNKNNVKKFSDSIFTEFMKVYSLKKETDSLFITFSIDSLQDKKTKIYYRIDTSFHYKVKYFETRTLHIPFILWVNFRIFPNERHRDKMDLLKEEDFKFKKSYSDTECAKVLRKMEDYWIASNQVYTQYQISLI